MGLFSKIDHHATLMNRMADTVHTDLAGALASNRLSSHELRNAVMACAGCQGSTDCPDWLEAHNTGAADTPTYCRNQDLFTRLRS